MFKFVIRLKEALQISKTIENATVAVATDPLQKFLKGVAEGLVDFLEGEEVSSWEGGFGQLLQFSFLVQFVQMFHFGGAGLCVPGQFNDVFDPAVGHCLEEFVPSFVEVDDVFAVGVVPPLFDFEDILEALAAEKDAVFGQSINKLFRLPLHLEYLDFALLLLGLPTLPQPTSSAVFYLGCGAAFEPSFLFQFEL